MEDKKDDYLKDWQSSVISHLNESEDITVISEYMLHIARIIDYPDLSISQYMNQMEKIGNELKANIKNAKGMRPTHIIEKINDFFFEEKKFQPNINDYYNPINNYLNIVLEKRTGIPLTLSIIYIHFANFIDFKLHPINFPSHFLVKYILDEESNESIVIDPFNKGRIIDDYILQDMVNKAYPRTNIPFSTNLLEKAKTSQILTRTLNNLKNGYSEVDDIDKIIKINEMILSLDSSNPEAIRDKGIIAFRYKNYDEALQNLYKYIEINPEASDIDKVLELVKQIRNTLPK